MAEGACIRLTQLSLTVLMWMTFSMSTMEVEPAPVRGTLEHHKDNDGDEKKKEIKERKNRSRRRRIIFQTNMRRHIF